MTDREFDLLLRSALLELNRKELEEAAHLDPIEPSPRYLRWRIKFLVDPFRYGKKHTRPLWRKVLRVALSAVLVIVLTFGAVLAVYPPARQWVARWFETYTSFTFPGTSNAYRTPDGLCVDYLPEGFELVEEDVNELRGILTFKNSMNTSISLTYFKNNFANLSVDNENSDYSEIILKNGSPAILFTSKTSSESNRLIWTLPSIETAFSLVSPLDIKELILIAEGCHF